MASDESKKKPGPKADRLQVKRPWGEAVKKAMDTPPPPKPKKDKE